MSIEYDNRGLLPIDDDDVPPRSFSRWLPTLVVSCAVIGFVVLAWYAYHSGGPAVKEEDLLVVEADKTPIKEKPLDPGGMKFPHQDKTVFDTFAGNAQAPKVERVLPAPEEPMPAEADNGETKTWINENLHKKTEDPAAAADSPKEKPQEQIIADEKKPDPAPPVNSAAPQVSSAVVQVGEVPVATVAHSPDAVKPPETAAPVTVAPVALQIPTETPTTKPSPVKAAPGKPALAKVKSTGGVSAQLGAYRTEADAQKDWAKIQKKYADALAGRQPTIVKADLGEKGIYYRLRVAGFVDGALVKAFCARLSAKGQACMLPVGK